MTMNSIKNNPEKIATIPTIGVSAKPNTFRKLLPKEEPKE